MSSESTSTQSSPGHLLSRTRQAQLCCEAAKREEDSGNYELAGEALSDFWRGAGRRPDLSGLERFTQADVLLRAGCLTGWLGSLQKRPGSQEMAKDLISESIDEFRSLGESKKVIEGLHELAVCYSREGAFEEARVVLLDALDRLQDSSEEFKAIILIQLARVERSMHRVQTSLETLRKATPLLESAENQSLKGRFHVELANTLTAMADVERREFHLEKALLEYTAASSHFEQGGYQRYWASSENNLGILLLKLNRFQQARGHLDRARQLFLELKDAVSAAQVDETRARAFLAEGRLVEAKEAIVNSVSVLRGGTDRGALSMAETTLGTVLTLLGEKADARLVFHEARKTSKECGSAEVTAHVLLSMMEALGEDTGTSAFAEAYREADRLIAAAGDVESLRRLLSCARPMITEAYPGNVSDNGLGVVAERANEDSSGESGKSLPGNSNEGWKGCDLPREVLQYESALIRKALETAGGSITRAARLLNLSYQNLSFALMGRHKELLSVRNPIRPRRRSILRRSHSRRRSSQKNKID